MTPDQFRDGGFTRVKDYKRSHHCNDICRALGLKIKSQITPSFA